MYIYIVKKNNSLLKENLANFSELEFVKNKIFEHDYKAVGEIGIDLFHEKKFL